MKKGHSPYQQSSPSQGQFSTLVSLLFPREYALGLLLPLLLIVLYWLVKEAA